MAGRLFSVAADGAGASLREPDQSAWRALHVGVFQVEFLDNATNLRWISEPCPGRLPGDESGA
jgi:hypothetical protein